MIVPEVIAHRGASAHAPENTLAAFRLAAQMNAVAIETDLRYTLDRQFVLLHDAHVNRTTDGLGRIAQLELNQARRLDAGSWLSARFSGERIPTLEEGIELAESLNLGIYLEMKVRLDDPLRFSLVKRLRDFHLDRMVLLSFHAAELRAMRKVEPRLKTALLLRRTRSALRDANEAGASLLAPHRNRVSARLVDAAHRAGLGLVTWTVDAPREMRKMLALGVDGIMTNHPGRLARLLRENGFPSEERKPNAVTPWGRIGNGIAD